MAIRYHCPESWPDEAGSFVSIQDYMALQDQYESAKARASQMEELYVRAEKQAQEQIEAIKQPLTQEIQELSLKLNRVIEAASALAREINR